MCFITEFPSIHDQNAISAQWEQRPFNKDGRQDHPIINEIALSEPVLSDSIGGWPLISFLRKAFFPLLVVYVLCDCHLTGVGSFFLRLSELILLIIITPNYETITLGRKCEFGNDDFIYN